MIWTVVIWALRVKIEIRPGRDTVLFMRGDGAPFAEWDGQRLHVLPWTAGGLAEDLPMLLANALAGPSGWVRVADIAPAERLRVLLQQDGHEVATAAVGGIWQDLAVPVEPDHKWRLIRARKQEVERASAESTARTAIVVTCRQQAASLLALAAAVEEGGEA